MAVFHVEECCIGWRSFFAFRSCWQLYNYPTTYNMLTNFLPDFVGAAINLMMADGMVSIGDGKTGGEASPSNKRRGSNLGATNAPTAPVAASRVKRSPQGSVAGESSTKGSERDEMEEISNEEGRRHRLAVHSVGEGSLRRVFFLDLKL